MTEFAPSPPYPLPQAPKLEQTDAAMAQQLREQTRVTEEMRGANRGLGELAKIREFAEALFKDGPSTVRTLGAMLAVAFLPSVLSEADRVIENASGVLEPLRTMADIAAAQGLPIATGAIMGLTTGPSSRLEARRRQNDVMRLIKEKQGKIASDELVPALVRYNVPIQPRNVKLWLNGNTVLAQKDDPRIKLVEAIRQARETQISQTPGTTKREKGRMRGQAKTEILDLFTQAQLKALQTRASTGGMRADVRRSLTDAVIGATAVGGAALGLEVLAGPTAGAAAGLVDDGIALAAATAGGLAEKVAVSRGHPESIVRFRAQAPKAKNGSVNSGK